MEKAIERYFNRKALLRGLLSRKYTSPGCTGVSDRLLCGPIGAIPGKGRTWYVELKDTGRKPRKRQEFVHKEYLQHGIIVHVLDSYESIDTFFNIIDNEIRTAQLPDRS